MTNTWTGVSTPRKMNVISVGREQRVERAHGAEHVAMAEAIAHHAEHRRDQRAEVLAATRTA